MDMLRRWRTRHPLVSQLQLARDGDPDMSRLRAFVTTSAIFSVFSGSINNLADDHNARGIVQREVACDSAMTTGLEDILLVAGACCACTPG